MTYSTSVRFHEAFAVWCAVVALPLLSAPSGLCTFLNACGVDHHHHAEHSCAVFHDDGCGDHEQLPCHSTAHPDLHLLSAPLASGTVPAPHWLMADGTNRFAPPAAPLVASIAPPARVRGSPVCTSQAFSCKFLI